MINTLIELIAGLVIFAVAALVGTFIGGYVIGLMLF